MSPSIGMSAFRYLDRPHVRRHGPFGYTNYKSFKQWLRDEFSFRCAFCLARERWCHDGSNGFGVDHIVPKSVNRDLECCYDNLLYLCNRCNSAKRLSAVIDPCKTALDQHLRLEEDGTFVALSNEGRHVINALNLNYQLARNFRKRKMEALSHWHENGDSWSIQQELAYPDDLPDLDLCKCKNAKPTGLLTSYYVRRETGDLPASYEV